MKVPTNIYESEHVKMHTYSFFQIQLLTLNQFKKSEMNRNSNIKYFQMVQTLLASCTIFPVQSYKENIAFLTKYQMLILQMQLLTSTVAFLRVVQFWILLPNILYLHLPMRTFFKRESGSPQFVHISIQSHSQTSLDTVQKTFFLVHRAT